MNAGRVSDILSPLVDRPTQAYLSRELQITDVIDWILAQTGPAALVISSFSVSEELLRRLWHIRQGRNVSDITLVLDRKATQKTISLWHFMKDLVCEVHLSDNHSKVVLVLPDDRRKSKVAIVSSQNLTRGNRHEATVISSDPDVCGPLYEDLLCLVSENSIMLDDLFGDAIEYD